MVLFHPLFACPKSGAKRPPMLKKSKMTCLTFEIDGLRRFCKQNVSISYHF